MSLIWLDGFEDQQTPNANGYTGTLAASALSTTARTGTRASPSMGNNATLIRALGSDEHATLVLGFAIRLSANAPDTLDEFFSMYGDTGATRHLTFNVKTDGAIEVRRGTSGGTILGTTAASQFVADTWYYLEIKAVLHDSTGSVHIRKNGSEILALTGQDTKNAGTETVFDQVLWQGMSGASMLIDDLYILNGVDSGISGQPDNDFLGDCRVDQIMPDGDTATEELTLSAGSDSFALIDETPPNGDTDYIESDVVNEKTQVTLGALPTSGHTVFGVRVSMTARKDDAGDASIRSGIFSDATAANGADQALTTSFVTYNDIFDDDPDGGVAWTEAAVNALQAFVEVR